MKVELPQQQGLSNLRIAEKLAVSPIGILGTLDMEGVYWLLKLGMNVTIEQDRYPWERFDINTKYCSCSPYSWNPLVAKEECPVHGNGSRNVSRGTSTKGN